MPGRRSIKFLLVDDLEANLLALDGLLKRDGLELLHANSGREALELLLVNDIALALVDVQMPEMDGFELAEIMRGAERTRTVPIIFLTAGVVDQQRRIRGYETGAVDFLPKPIDPENLRNKANVFFDLASQRERLLESEDRLRATNELLGRKNEELARADQRKNEFLAMLAHELRNPLAPLLHAAEILRMPAAGPAERDHSLALITHQVGNMRHMIDDLLDVSRISEGKIELKKSRVELAGLLKMAADVAKPMCEGNRQQLLISFPAETLWLEADPTRIEQIFGNLLTNAAKYSGESSTIRIAVERAPDKDEAIVRVSDNGPGISADLLPRIFDLFVQAPRTLDRAHGGLGIGLTIVHRLVLMHGGTIEAHSDGLGKGTQFIVRLPLAEQLPEPATIVTPVSSRRSSRRILIVDDNADSARTMAMLQRLRGHETRIADSGPAALEAAADFVPGIVLLDIGLPGMDGYEVAKKLREIPSTRDAFLIALTGYGSEEHRARTREAGFNEHLVKPANLEVLRTWIEGLD